MGKRRSVQINKLSRINDLSTTATEQPLSSPTSWFSSIKTQKDDVSSTPMSSKSSNSTPEVEVKLQRVDNVSLDKLTDKNDEEQFDGMSPTSGLKTGSFYGGHTPSFQFGLRQIPSKELKQKQAKKNNSQVKRNSKRKRVTTKNTNNHAVKKTKQDDSSFKGVVNGEFHRDIPEKKLNGVVNHVSDASSTILDIIITPESSPSDNEDTSVITTNGFHTEDKDQIINQDTDNRYKQQSNHCDNTAEDVATSYCKKVINDGHHIQNIIENDSKMKTKTEEFSETGSQFSDDSLISGFGSVNGSSLIKGENGEYYFSNSNENSPDLNVNGPSKFFQTPTSNQSSPNSNYALSRKTSALFSSGKDSEGSSYSPSSSSSNTVSPEHQTSITSFFKCSTKLPGNAVSTCKAKSLDRSKKSNKDENKKMEQMYLDLGQRNFGHVTCSTCGMVYTHGQPDDEAEHIRHHKKFVKGLRFNGWKDEHVVKEYSDGRVIMIKSDDPTSHQKKAEEIRKVVDSELGFAVDLPYRKNESKIFLFIAKKLVVGCCVATQIDKGYQVLPGTPNKDSTPDRQIAAWCCSTVPVPAQCGISKIWVWNQYRRKKVATRLIECVRTHFIYGCVISKDMLAFSDPTPDGKRLATAYIGTPEFLVFH